MDKIINVTVIVKQRNDCFTAIDQIDKIDRTDIYRLTRSNGKEYKQNNSNIIFEFITTVVA